MKRKEFKFLEDHIYLDSAAGSLKPNSVIKAVTDFYTKYSINPHSKDSKPGVELYNKVTETRELVGKLVEASPSEVIFTSGATDALNKFAMMFEDHLKKDDEIVLSYSNHASAIVPFIEIANKKGAKVRISNSIVENINDKTKLVVIPQQTNSVDYDDSWLDIVAKAKSVGAILVNDAAQAISHSKVTLKESDVITLSGNKLYGPTGTGALIIREEILKTLKPKVYGGGATSNINDDLTWVGKGYIGDYEAGTPNTAGIVGLGAAIKFFNEMVSEGAIAYEKELAKYAFDKLNEIENIEMFSKKGDVNILFNLPNVNAQDVVSSLGHQNIILRSGTHCAHLTGKLIENRTTIRLSVAPYNNREDIDQAVKALKGGDFFDFI